MELDDLRKHLHITQEELGQEMGVTAAAVCQQKDLQQHRYWQRRWLRAMREIMDQREEELRKAETDLMGG